MTRMVIERVVQPVRLISRMPLSRYKMSCVLQPMGTNSPLQIRTNHQTSQSALRGLVGWLSTPLVCSPHFSHSFKSLNLLVSCSYCSDVRRFGHVHLAECYRYTLCVPDIFPCGFPDAHRLCLRHRSFRLPQTTGRQGSRCHI